jgi:alpha-amylase
LWSLAGWLVKEFSFDGIRIDTIKHVRKDYWSGFVNAGGVFAMGENLNGDPAFVGSYQEELPSLLNFPMYFTLTGA